LPGAVGPWYIGPPAHQDMAVRLAARCARQRGKGESMRKVWLIAALAGALLLAFGSGLLLAGGADHPRDVGTAALETSKGKGGGCGMAAATNNETLTPDDDDTVEADNTALKVVLTKTCSGPVVADFETETLTGAGGFIHADARAKCMGGGCPAGVEKIASPGHTFLQNNPSTGIETHGMVFVFHQLGPGKWQFRIGVGGNGAGSVVFRGLMVEAFQKP
jgi:hypothetical protein